MAESINDPAVGDLTGAGHDDVVVASNEVYGAPELGGELSFAGVTAAAAGTSGRLYAIDGSDRQDPAGLARRDARNHPGRAAVDRTRPGRSDREDRR